ncbi:nose resistant to fluoxetine protein 6-like isoform X2 [Chrysoperla carnea]|uniref:nose resistant to fluoxetine protein 6-like isoform X2 n=1 Tax=Chrysoperla carnea TaxID=189513 RepID=UPI001D06908C|nr:nose resistant to fluoxetine protein 6-like isoform X2 [Chrysoperla carnea]
MIHLKIYLVNIIFITICLIQCVQTAGELENLLKQTIYTVYAPKTKVVENEKCVEQSKIYYDALMNNQNWALKMFDASGKVIEGFYSYNNVDLGQFDQCLSFSENVNNTLIKGKYCLTTMTLASKNESTKSEDPEVPTITQSLSTASIKFRWAICVPAVCTAEDVQNHLNYVLGDKFSFTVKESNCQSKETMPTLTAGDWAMIGVLVLVGLLLLTNTIYDGYLIYYNLEPLHPLLLSFSIISNGQNIAHINKNPDQFHCLHGIRWFSMMWVVIGHRFLFQTQNAAIFNKIGLETFLETWYNYLAIGGQVAVDSFFVMAGMLSMYLFLKAKSAGKPVNILLMYIHRYLRLTPPIVFALLFVLTLSKFVGSGPFWPTSIKYERKGCEESWWALLLYIQNYRPVSKICLQHSWYLSSDTQLFFIGPFIMLFVYRFKKIAYYLFSGLIVIFIIVPCLVAIHYDIRSAYKDMLGERMIDFFHYYYFPSHTRAATYIIGLTLGYIMFEKKKTKVIIPPVYNILCWVLSLGVMLLIILFQYPINQPNYEYIKWIDVTYTSLHRVFWSIALSWIIFACSFGYGGPINWLLTRPIFQVLAKLTYCMYIVHYSILVYRNGSVKTVQYFNNMNTYYEYCGDLIFTTIVGAIWSFSFEMPFGVIEGYLFRGLKPKSRSKPVIPLANGFKDSFRSNGIISTRC